MLARICFHVTSLNKGDKQVNLSELHRKLILRKTTPTQSYNLQALLSSETLKT